MTVHSLKILEHFADAVVSGDKTFEVRKDDRIYCKGDSIKFTAVSGYVDDRITTVQHPINEKVYEITYVLKGWGIKDGYCVFGIKEVQE